MHVEVVSGVEGGVFSASVRHQGQTELQTTRPTSFQVSMAVWLKRHLCVYGCVCVRLYVCVCSWERV